MHIKERAGAWHLLGKNVESGWIIKEPVGWDPSSGETIGHYNTTGGNYSVPYIVESRGHDKFQDGHRAFLKAIDLTSILYSPNLLREMKKISTTYEFEARILQICGDANMSRVVVAIESGEMEVGPNMQDRAPYFIFELAEGDVRKRIQKKSNEVRLEWWLRAMHHATTGLFQLHKKGIVHQDIKPSNLLSFERDDVFKVSDLGRSVCEGEPSPHDLLPYTGDTKYAPPEILYNYINPQVKERRLRNELWMLGSMIFFFVRGFGATQLLIDELEISQRPIFFGGAWNDGYKPLLPLLRHSFTKLLHDLEINLSKDLSDDDRLSRELVSGLVKAASELCNPDHMLRGHPLARFGSGNPHSLERYISLFDRLAKIASLKRKWSKN